MSHITFQQVTKYFGQTAIFEHLNLIIEHGEFITLTGKSGEGKTTLLRLINGLESYQSGAICIDNQPIDSQSLYTIRRKIGYAIQGAALFPHMTVAQNMLYVPSLSARLNKAESTERLNTLLEIVSLDTSLLNRYPDELSGGQQQRVGIARALAAKPNILLMDEPFGALDPETRSQLQSAIKSIHQHLKLTVVFVTHDTEEAKLLATRQLVVRNQGVEVLI